MANVDVNCASCGAQTPAPDDGTPVKCMYCGGAGQFIKQKTDSAGGSNPQVENMITLAENASEAKNFSEAYNYYNKAIELDMTHSKAWAGKGIAAVWQSTLADVRSGEMQPAFKNAMQHCSNDDERTAILTYIAENAGEAYLALCNLAASHWSEFGTKYTEGVGEIPEQVKAAEHRTYINNFLSEYSEFYEWHSEQEYQLKENTGKELHLDLPLDHYYVEMLDYVFGNFVQLQGYDTSAVGGWNEIWFKDNLDWHEADTDVKEDSIAFHPWSKRKHPADFDLYGIYAAAIINREEQRNYDEINEEWKEKYPIHDPRLSVSGEAPGGACFIATVSLGETDWRELAVLRRFRDEILLTNLPGRIFVRWYYRYGPHLARAIEKKEIYRAFVRRTFVIPGARLISWVRGSEQ